MKENLLAANCESDLDENIHKNENKFNRLSMQLNSLRLLEKATIILIAVPYTLSFTSIVILFPYLFVFYISEEVASNLFALLLVLIYNFAYLLGSITAPTPCFGDRLGWSFALNALFVLFFLFTILINILYFHTMNLSENDFYHVLWTFLPIIGSFLAGFSSFNLSQLHYIYLMNCLNSYNRELVLTLFYKIFSFGILIGAIFSFFFHLNFLILLCVFQLISIIMFIFLKKPDLIFKEYITSLYKDYKLKELLSKNTPIKPENSNGHEKKESIIAGISDTVGIGSEEDEDMKISSLAIVQKHMRKRSSFKDIQSHIFKKDMRFLTALSALEALISSYLVLIIPSTILNEGINNKLGREYIFYRFSYCFLVIGLSSVTTLFVKKFNFLEDPNYSCNELLKAFSFLIVVYAFGHFFNFYPLVLFACCFMGYCYFLTILVIENQIFLNFEHINVSISSVNMTNCLIKALIFVIGLILIDTNPCNSLIIYIILIFFIWCLIKK